MRLLRVELRRFRLRALIRWGAVGAVAVALLLVAGAFQTSTPLPQAQIDEIRAQYDEQVADWDAHKDEYIADCKQQEADAQEADPSADYACEQGGPGAWEDWIGGTSSFSDAGISSIQSFGVVFLLLALFLGITFAAAETSSGAIGNWLTFEPRRRRVYWSKLAAASLGVLPIVAVALAVGTAGSWLAYEVHDATGSMTAALWTDLGWSLGRLLLGSAAFAAIGVALGMLTRHTAAALGVVVAWFVVVELFGANMLDGLQRWLLVVNTEAWVAGGATYSVETCTPSDGGGLSCSYVDHAVSLAQGGLVLAGLTIVVAVVSALVFRRRDVA
ncbi:ABC transporter permease subunit [Cellulomonas sp. PhB143]|uniref:ABC transporter permease subunit n=1 Tax=Cellulomonas sp. PhB143 TaxID=2485186 RepID=UPI000F485CD3|nr:ABC transporter permease subunit [Cellulomonas sp. PhB143]ROS73522.1 ABC-2 type transport system permease protein [Cellulomonas sp. PhB143]